MADSTGDPIATLRDVVQALKDRRGWSNDRLAFECGVNVSSVRRFLAGRVPDGKTALTLLEWATEARTAPLPCTHEYDLLESYGGRSVGASTHLFYCRKCLDIQRRVC